MARNRELTLWHYTTGQKFMEIVATGHIKPATKGVPSGERPIVWFSSHQYWEPTAAKMLYNEKDNTLINMDMKGTFEHGGGLVRLGVSRDVAVYDFGQLKRRSGMSRATADGLIRAAKSQGSNPEWWFGTFDPVPVKNCVGIHVFQDDDWVPVPTGERND